MIKISGIIIFQIFFALKFLNGFKNGRTQKSNMANPIMQTTLASNLKPMMKAEPEKAFPGGLNFQKMINRETVITSNKIKTTENTQRKSFGIRCIKSMKNYLMTEQI